MCVGPRLLGINDRDIGTLCAAIEERVMFYYKAGSFLEPLKPQRGAFSKLRCFKLRVLSRFGQKPSPLTPEEFVECYKGRRRTIYEAAAREFSTTKIVARHAKVSTFVKAEKVPLDKSPRAIQPRSTLYNVGVGVFLKHIEHGLYRAIARLFNQRMVVSKGLNVKQLGCEMQDMWMSLNKPCFVGFDASRFDMHVSVDALRWEHSVYVDLYNGNEELKRLLRMQLVNRGVGRCADGRVKYQVDGRRMSGDMNTALGNCLIVCGIFYKYMIDNSISCKFVDNGDDCGVFIEQDDLHQLAGIGEWFKTFGFRLEVEEPVYMLEKVVFCQMQPILTPTGVIMVRQLAAALQKDTMTIVKMCNAKVVRKWMWSVGECGLALCSGIPVMQAFYSTYMELGLPSNMSNATYMECGARHLSRGLESKVSAVDDVTRFSFWKAFGLTPMFQMELEDRYARMSLDGALNVDGRDLIPSMVDARIDQIEVDGPYL